MWGKDKSKKVDFDRHAGKTTMIAKGTTITGNIQFAGGLLVEGVVEGNVRAEDSTDALLRLSEAGLIKGEIRAPNVVVNGKVTGDVFSTGHVELAAKAVVNGNVHYNLIEMVMGAEVNGSLVHDQTGSAGAIPAIELPVKAKPPEAPVVASKKSPAPQEPPRKPKAEPQAAKPEIAAVEKPPRDSVGSASKNSLD